MNGAARLFAAAFAAWAWCACTCHATEAVIDDAARARLSGVITRKQVQDFYAGIQVKVVIGIFHLDMSFMLRSDGCLLDSDGNVLSAVDLAVTPPTDDSPFPELYMLLVPRKAGVSALYLRELLNGDATVRKTIRDSFAATPDVAAFAAALKSMKLYLPSKSHHQFRCTFEVSAIRQWLLNIVATLANEPRAFPLQAERKWHLAHALRTMLDQSWDQG